MEKIAKIVHSRGNEKSKRKNSLMYQDFKEEVPFGLRRRIKARQPLKLEEKVDIVYQVLICKESQKDLSRKYRTS